MTARLTVLPERPLLLDGSMGQELIKRGVAGHGLLWSAGALLEAPRAVLEIHRDYISAGADIISTNTYAATRVVLGEAGLDHRFEALNILACELALEARERSGRPVRLAGSLPPYQESYRPDLVGCFDEIEPLYREQAALLAQHVDLVLCETLSTAEEGRAAAAGASAAGKPVWVSWTLEDHLRADGSARLRSGETLDEAVAALNGLDIAALLVNCSPPEVIGRAVVQLRSLTRLPVGAYGNAFTPIPPMWEHHNDADLPPARTDLGPDAYAGHARDWLDSGAAIIGGCCEIGPAHIARLRELIDRRG
ncbi:MAG: homocysteine S-methyltransferase family protein [Xanthomonadales bacterium]|nr:homocysteine S-methyltransferase family protein [Xanthomonadales bacterium]